MESDTQKPDNGEMEILVKYFENIKKVIQYTKTKDEIINKQGEELSHYRDGFVSWAFRSFALSLIDFRESAKKDIEALEKYPFDYLKVKKNISYLLDDYLEMLSNNGVTEKDGEFYYGSMKIDENVLKDIDDKTDDFSETQNDGAEPGTSSENSAEAETETVESDNNDGSALTSESPASGDESAEPVTEASSEAAAECEITEDPKNEHPEIDLAELVTGFQNDFLTAVKDNEALEEAYYKLTKQAAEKDNLNKWVFIYPVLKILVSLSKSGSQISETVPENDDDAKCVYRDILVLFVRKIAYALEIMGVTIVNTEDVFNTSVQRLSKVIKTTVPELDRVVAAKITDAYAFEGKMIYLQKADVYKYSN